MRGDPARRVFSRVPLQGSVICLATGITLADASGVCGLQPIEFVRAFQGSTGLSPPQWLFQRRIHRALELLRDPNRSFVEVVLLAGFSDQGTFARVFVRKTGPSPEVWRHRLASRR
ncbi:AraC-like DNA-binding protein [Paraburkholderia sp. GAS448]|uniref:helix-turn-helix transcriptional regulator n=1 Tax=Paraburkholderia sp. GAS448 TaxID=3035136 RepID=UPI003D25B92F